jgi:hypothetical protein
MDSDGDTAARGDMVDRRRDRPHRARRVGAVVVTAGVALVCSAAAAFVLFALGLSVHPLIVLPLAVAGTALVAALSAAWTSTLIARDGTRADLGAVLRRVVPTAVVLLVVVPPLTVFAPILFIAVALTFGALSVVAAHAAWTRRTSVGTASGDVRFTLVVLAIAAAATAAALLLASMAGLTGA